MKNDLPQKNIPEGWEMIPAGDVFSFVKTFAFSRENLCGGDLENGDIGNIHYGDIHSTFSSPSIDLAKVKIPTIKDRDFTPKPPAFLKDGDLVMADASEDYEGVGVTVSIHGIGKKKVVGGLHTFVLRDNKHRTDEYYRQYIFRNPLVRNALQKVANGVSVYGISKTSVSKVLLPIPPLSEQKRIADVLKTWDRAINTLDKEIAVKKEAKRGLMQELLTGKKRLPGFKEAWKKVKLGDVVIIKRGDALSKSSLVQGSVPVIAGGQKPAYFHRESNRNGLTITVSGSGAYAGYVDFYDCPIFVSDAMSVQEKILNIHFAYFFLKLRQNYIYSLQTGGAQPHIYPKDLQRLKLDIPDSRKEQSEIANVLVTADKEIISLERKIKILQEQRRYLLNNLITGAIRLASAEIKVGKVKSTTTAA